MKFTKFGKTLLMSTLSMGIIFGVSSCVVSYTVGYLYVTGTETAQSGNNGIITGLKIDHNTGHLSQVNGPIRFAPSSPLAASLFTSLTAAQTPKVTATAPPTTPA